MYEIENQVLKYYFSFLIDTPDKTNILNWKSKKIEKEKRIEMFNNYIEMNKNTHIAFIKENINNYMSKK